MNRTAATLLLLRHHRAVRALVRAAGATPVHLVGGVLRDRLLGLPLGDIDAVVEANGREIAGRLAAALPARLVLLGGKKFAAYRLVATDWKLDLWDRSGMSLEQDLARRDFTVNAMAFSPADGRLFDSWGGCRDLTDHILRATTPRSFTEDPLRVLRLSRLLVQLPGFAPEPATVQLARLAAPLLGEIAAERVREELGLTLAGFEAHRGVAVLSALGLYPGLWLGKPGDGSRATPGTVVHELELLDSARLTLRHLGAEPDLLAARQAILFLNLPSETGPPLQHLEHFAAAGYVSRTQAARVQPLLQAVQLPDGERAARRFLYELGELWSTAVAVLGARHMAAGEGTKWRTGLDEIAALLGGAGHELPPLTLVSGKDALQILRIPAGPRVGSALRQVRRAQIDGEVTTREEALQLLRSLKPD
jgi:tRNA nucleotidyltransferase (CCA-adding enzyme)